MQAAAERQESGPQQQPADPAAELPPLLSGVRIVLVSPKTPANIGAVLRVAENFEVRRLDNLGRASRHAVLATA